MPLMLNEVAESVVSRCEGEGDQVITHCNQTRSVGR